jgi:glycosyltransferase involved in cell wall biosynthesis
VLVVDTGRTDDTVQIAEELGCTIRQHEWKNFGDNRTRSFQEAVSLAPCIRDAEWALVIDADMKLVCDADRLLDFLDKSTDAGLTMLQEQGTLEYRNVRIMRLSEDWRCKGVTHEYWVCRHGTVGEIPTDIAYIDDVGDGGCKDDKFERDERMLTEGLLEEPDNERYLFYLANTKSLRTEG